MKMISLKITHPHFSINCELCLVVDVDEYTKTA